MKVDGGKAALAFDHVGGGLIAKELVPTTTAEPNRSAAPPGA